MTSEEPNNTGGTSSLTTSTTSSSTITKATNHKTQRGFISESSTISDNTSDFIEIVKKYEVVYNNHHPDYKNVEVKAKIWSQIAEEIGLSVGKQIDIFFTLPLTLYYHNTKRTTPALYKIFIKTKKNAKRKTLFRFSSFEMKIFYYTRC